MTFLSAEQSVESSEPLELYSISINDGVTTYCHTSGSRNVVYGGNLYTAIAMQRGQIEITMPGAEKDLILTLPIDHPLPRRWTAQGIPPRKVELTVYRQNGSETEIIWYGAITSMSAEGRTAKFRVPSRAGEWMLRPIPAFTVGRDCGHVLYDAGCGVLRTGSHGGLAHKVAGVAVTYVNGRDIRVNLASTSRNGTWAEGGEVVHAVTGERMGIALQTDLNPGVNAVTTLRMQMQIVGLQVGHVVDVYAGCIHTVEVCETKFGARANFIGFPQMPTRNPFVPAGYGVGGNS